MIDASIILTNYNYGQFLRPAIDSALQQAGCDVEVIVVDDGSTDDSRSIISSFADRIHPIFKRNGGQASAFNAGFAASRGRVVLFLDADDLLLPTAAQHACEALDRTGAAKVHWPLRVIDSAGSGNGKFHPNTRLPEGDFRQTLIDQGPWMCEVPPTSGNAFSRGVLKKVFPVPQDEFRICADIYLLTAAAMLGMIHRIDQPLSCYRLHDRNNYWNHPFQEAVRRGVRMYDLQCRTASRLLGRRHIAHDPSRWRRFSWWHRLHDAVEDVVKTIPAGDVFMLADGDEWGTPDVLRGRWRIAYAAHPADDAAAMRQLDESLADNVRWFVLGWPCFWYLRQYPSLAQHLRKAKCVLRNERVTIFELSPR